MQRLFLYVVLVISYLGLSKAFAPTELGVNYVPNARGLTKSIPGQHVSVILTDMHATGFIIKTYYQKYRLVYGFQGAEEMIVRTSRDFAKKNRHNVGLSIFRRFDGEEETLPMPPGGHLVGKREYGEWFTTKSGKQRWRFYRAYRNLPKYYGWGAWRPGPKFHEEYLAHREKGERYVGSLSEFGSAGRVSRKNFPHFFAKERQRRIDLKSLLLNYLRENF
jgi:hypothetical protein